MSLSFSLNPDFCFWASNRKKVTTNLYDQGLHLETELGRGELGSEISGGQEIDVVGGVNGAGSAEEGFHAQFEVLEVTERGDDRDKFAGLGQEAVSKLKI